MKNKKIIFTLILFIVFSIIGTLKVNATQEINNIDEMINLLGKENIEVTENQIKVLKDIDLMDNFIVNSGNYILDLNGKTMSYTKGYDSVFYMLGGNLTIKDETNNGQIISKMSSISCYNGVLKIENCKINKEIYVCNEANVQIDDGEFLGTVIISEGTLIINGGLFKNGLEVIFEPFTNSQPTVIVNDGEFYGNHAGLYIWFSSNAENVQLKGGTFKGNDEEIPAIYVGCKDFSLNELLPIGYRFDNNEQIADGHEHHEGEICYHTKSSNNVSVEKFLDTSINKLIFVDYDGNTIETKDILESEKFTLPKAPEKEGYVFVGWDIDTENVIKDMIITPIYEKIYKFKISAIYPEYYNGEEIKPNIVVIDEITKKALSDDDYEIICENNINVGTARVLIQGKGKYKHCNKQAEFRIMPVDIYYNCEAYYQREFEYTGEEIKPNVKVYYKDFKLVNGVDYEISYESNINAGIGRIIITGIGNYKGKTEKTFRIYPRIIDEVILKQQNFLYTGNEIFPEFIVKAGNIELIKNIDYRVYYNNNIEIGTGTIIIDGIGNYSGRIENSFNIVSKKLNNTNVRVDLSNKHYTGGYIRPSVVIYDGNYKLRENFDYKVQYSNNLNIGRASIKIKGINGYTGNITKTFDIIPKTIEIKSIKAPIIRTVKLTWQKDSSIDGYEIYRSNNKEGNYSLVKTVNKNNKDSHIFLAHKKGTYFYTIRTYKKVNGNKVYSDFSTVKEIKVR